MKISLIELDFHHDCVDGFCKTFQNTDHSINIFIKRGIFEKLKKQSYVEKYNWYLCEKTSRTRFLKKNIQKINDSDVIFIDTIAYEFGAYVKAGFESLTVSRVHNAFKLLDPWNHIRIIPTPFYLWKAISYFIREIVINRFWYFRPLLIKRLDYFVFPDEGITNFAISSGLIDPLKVLSPIPLKVYEGSQSDLKDPLSPFRITIIGGIDYRRRDYNPVIKAFESLATRLKEPVILTFLGKSKGKYADLVLRRFKKIENKNLIVEYFRDSLNQIDFDKFISQTQIFISPIRLHANVEIWGEIYGKTKITGSLLDMIRFPRVMFIPAEYQLSQEAGELIDQYSDPNELRNKLETYLNNKEILKEKTAFIKSRIEMRYSPKFIADSFVQSVDNAFFKRPTL